MHDLRVSLFTRFDLVFNFDKTDTVPNPIKRSIQGSSVKVLKLAIFRKLEPLKMILAPSVTNEFKELC